MKIFLPTSKPQHTLFMMMMMKKKGFVKWFTNKKRLTSYLARIIYGDCHYRKPSTHFDQDLSSDLLE